MASDGATAGLEALNLNECRRLLGNGGIGRIALPSESAPIIRPVNFVLHRDAIVLRTAEGEILAAAERGTRVSFEIDDANRLEHSGWSVIVIGYLTESAADDETLALPLRPWAAGRRERFVSLSLEAVTGRRIEHRRFET